MVLYSTALLKQVSNITSILIRMLQMLERNQYSSYTQHNYYIAKKRKVINLKVVFVTEKAEKKRSF